MKRLRRGLALLLGALSVWLVSLAIQIVRTGEEHTSATADVAIVLGAAAYGHAPSPVFERRIQHGVHLHRTKRVRKLLFTRGRGGDAPAPEALVAALYARRAGVPAEAILMETVSHTTHQNLMEAQKVIRAEGLKTALIVSDPFHLKRALRMGSGLGIVAKGAPVPQSLYRSWKTKAGFLLRELYFYNVYLATGQ